MKYGELVRKMWRGIGTLIIMGLQIQFLYSTILMQNETLKSGCGVWGMRYGSINFDFPHTCTERVGRQIAAVFQKPVKGPILRHQSQEW